MKRNKLRRNRKNQIEDNRRQKAEQQLFPYLFAGKAHIGEGVAGNDGKRQDGQQEKAPDIIRLYRDVMGSNKENLTGGHHNTTSRRPAHLLRSFVCSM